MTLSKYKPLTKKQLIGVVSDYAALFPEWEVVAGGTGIARECGLVKQMIWFQKMTHAAYRPTHVINTTAISFPRMLHQLLDVRNREIAYRAHESKLRGVVIAMEQQFTLNIRRPLDVSEVLKLCEVEARRNVSNDLMMLAILYAWQGRDAEALEACTMIQVAPLPALASVPEQEEQLKTYGRSLASALKHGEARQFIEASMAELKGR